MDKGADVVVCQHTHCIGCEEKYNHGTIVYGQGNFLFDLVDNEFWNTGVLVCITDDFKIEYIPVVKKEETVRCASSGEKEAILKAFFERSEAIQDGGFVKQQYRDFANKMSDYYLSGVNTLYNNVFYKVLNKVTGYRFGKKFLQKLYDKFLSI